MENSVHNGRERKTDTTEVRHHASGIVMLVGAAICMTYLMIAISGRSADRLRLDSVSTAASAKLRENEAVAVFLGLDEMPEDESVYVWHETDGDEDDTYISPDKIEGKWTLWGYFSDLIRTIAEPMFR